MSLLEEYQALWPTRELWEVHSKDPKYIWNGKDYHPCIITPGKNDSDFIVWCYVRLPVLMQALKGLSEIKKDTEQKQKEITSKLASLKEKEEDWKRRESKLLEVVHLLESGNMIEVNDAHTILRDLGYE